jgi:hypothetical protein
LFSFIFLKENYGGSRRRKNVVTSSASRTAWQNKNEGKVINCPTSAVYLSALGLVYIYTHLVYFHSYGVKDRIRGILFTGKILSSQQPQHHPESDIFTQKISLTAEVHGSLILNFLKIIFTGFRQV